MSIIMHTIFPLQKIKGLTAMRIDIVPPHEKDKRWGVEVSGFINGVKFYALMHDETYPWLEEKIREYLKGLI